MKKLISLLIVAFSLPAFGATLCIGPSATGDGLGANWNNLRAWSATPVRGDTWLLVDGAYTGKTLSVAASGTTLITIKKATVADHGGISTGWSDTMGDGIATFSSRIVFGSSYWLFDGVTGGGWTSQESGHGFVVTETGASSSIIGIGNGTTANNITVSHTKLVGMQNANSNGGGAGNDGVSIHGDSNITLSYCWIFGAGRCPFFVAPVNLVVEYCNIGVFNYGSDAHAEIASIWGFGGTVGDVTFRYNLFTHVQSTGGIMWDNSGNNSAVLRVYGNVFVKRPGSPSWNSANGVVGGWTGGGGEQFRNALVYNNDFIDTESGGDALSNFPNTASGNAARNNLFYSVDAVGGGSIWATKTHNHFISTTAIGTSTSTDTGDPFNDMANLDFTLAANTTAGVDLGSPYNVDGLGRTRTTWTRGAFEYFDAVPDVTAPVVTAAYLNSAGDQLTVTFDEATTGNSGLTITASGGAATLSAPSGSGTSTRTWTISRNIASGETVTRSYTAGDIEDLAENALANFSTQPVTNNSTYEMDAPTPNPSAFAIAPTPDGATRVSFTANPSSDAHAIEYQAEINGTPGAWQASSNFFATGLSVQSTNYFRVRARDSFGNTTTFSSYGGTMTHTQVVYNTTGTFTVPAGVTNVLVECIGGGAGAGDNPVSARSGGGGGAYARTNVFPVVPAAVLTVTVGTGGAQNNPGTPSWLWNAATVCMAVGGTNSVNNGPTVGPGGAAASSVGSVRFSGGQGGARDSTSFEAAGGGGGSGGYFGAGTAGSPGVGSTGGAGGAAASDNGGTGGAGGNVSQSGTAGTSPGGGGGGAGQSGSVSGAGAAGRVIVSWGIPASDPTDNSPPTLLRVQPTGSNKFAPGPAYELVTAVTDNTDVASVMFFNYRTGASFAGEFVAQDRWSAQVPVVLGSNYCTAIASDSAGNSSAALPFTIFAHGTNNGTATTMSVTTVRIPSQE